MKKTIVKLISGLLIAAVLLAPAASAYDADSESEWQTGEALYIEKAPVIDGYYSAEEWGEGMTYSIYAQNPADAVEYETGNVYTKLYGTEFEAFDGWRADFCLRWDENYLYAAVLTNDPDVYNQNYYGMQIRDNDSVGLCIDPAGGEGYSVSSNAPSLYSAYSVSGGETCLWDANANDSLFELTEGFDSPAMAVTAPAFSDYTEDTEKGITTYETAIPWEFLLAGYNDADGNPIKALRYVKHTSPRGGNFDGGIGFSLGFSAVITDSGEDGISRAKLAFGNGLLNTLDTQYYLPGENGLYLSEQKAQQGENFDTYDPADIFVEGKYNNTVDAPGVFYDYLSGDFEETTPVDSSALTTLTFESEDDLTYFNPFEPFSECIVYEDEEHGNVMCINHTEEIFSSGILPFSGTEYDGCLPMSYTMEFDVKYDSDGSFFGNTFGGSGLDYNCGYYPEAKQFRIAQAGFGDKKGKVYAFCEKELAVGNWYHWKFQYDSISKTVRLWLTDDGKEELIFNISGRSNFASSFNCGFSLLMTGLTQCRFDNVKIYNFSEPADGTPEYTSVITGDINCDKKVSAADMLLERKAIVGSANSGVKCTAACDANFDGKINASDAGIIRKIIVGSY